MTFTETRQAVYSDATGHIPALDGLRGVAVGLVLVFHLMGAPFFFFGNVPSGFDKEWLTVISTGWIGVNLFFVLSGFLITGILYESKGPAWTYFRNFYARRILRIFPAYYALLFFLLVILVLLIPAESETLDFVRAKQLWFWTYLLNMRHFFVPASQIGPNYLTGHLWSLSVEEQFYLVWPVLVLIFPRRGLIALTIAMIMGAAVLRIILFDQYSTLVLYQFTPTRMDDLAIGALIALMIRRPESRRLLGYIAWPVAGVAFVGLGALFFARDGLRSFDPWMQQVGFSMLGLFFGGILAGVVLAGPRAVCTVALSHPYIRWVGKYSYAIYLIHLPLVNLILRHTSFYNSFPVVFGSFVPRATAFAILVAALTFLMAFLSWRLLESPFLRLRAKFPRVSPAGLPQATHN